MRLIVNGIATNFSRIGRGKLIVILHGWGDNSTSWLPFSKILARNYDVLVLDLPGFGSTEAPKETWGLTDYAQFIAAFLTKTNLRPYAIIGHSNGGAIAVRGISTGIFEPKKLVLLASAGIRGEYNGRNKVLRLMTISGKVLAAPLPSSMKKRLRHKLYKSIGSDMLVVENLQETFKRVVSDDVRGGAVSLSLPTLLIYGEDDTATPPRYGKLLHDAIKHSELVILSKTGHFLHLDKPVEVEMLVRDFLQ